MSPREAKKMIEMYDKDSDGGFDYAEFIRMMMFDPKDPVIPLFPDE